MQDRFKFRHWDKQIKQMRYGDIQLGCDGQPFVITNNKEKPVEDIKDVVTMQCTGLKDNTGKLIYEGEIVTDGRHNMLVYYDKETCSFALQKRTQYTQKRFGKDGFERVSLRNLSEDSLKNHQLKIIGNIYENPELLQANNAR